MFILLNTIDALLDSFLGDFMGVLNIFLLDSLTAYDFLFDKWRLF